VVLIDKLELDFRPGLSVLTGETGAGKSILLDALSLALGSKVDAGLIRAGSDGATVVAEFDDVILKRVISRDGKSKCWINDEPATQKALKERGDNLVEIHGQFTAHGLLDPKSHIRLLDSFGGLGKLAGEVRSAWSALSAAEKKLKELVEFLEKSAEEHDFLLHNIKELQALKPKIGEEEVLASAREKMMGMEKNAAILKDAATVLEAGDGRGAGGVAEKIFSALHILERTKSYQAEIDKLYDAASVVQEVAEAIRPVPFDASELEAAEERLFALRAAARKHKVAVDGLGVVLQKMQEQAAAIQDSGTVRADLEKDVRAKKGEFDKIAALLTQERIAASGRLSKSILKELSELKLGGADFKVEISSTSPSADGYDAALFMIKTNPGTPFAPLDKIASGGELARFMLALRVVMSGESSPKCLIFDEIDTGISGATAAAVGLRLSKLAESQQVIAITHSAQVAGFGDSHFLVSKKSDGKTTAATAEEISGDARVREIARIISGAKINPDAVEAAKKLIK
jgi:DNA repair protein RecN (Recombination protein N)